MKKIFFTTTALVAATVITSAAYADGMASTRYSSSMKSSSMSSANQLQSTRYLQQNDMMGASAFKLKIGGYANWMVGYADNSNVYTNQFGILIPANANEFDVMGEAQVHFDFAATLKNGIKLGAVSQLTTDTSVANAKIEQTYMYAETMYGKVMVGRHDNVNKQLAIRAIDLGPLDIQETELSRWVLNPLVISAVSQSTLGDMNVAMVTTSSFSIDDQLTKITYITPNFSGFQAGITYAPTGGNVKESVVNPTIPLLGGVGIDTTNLTAVYNGKYNDVGYGISAGYELIHTEFRTKINSWNIGGQTAYKGFTLSGGYKDTHAENRSGSNSDATVWDIGLAYETGPYGLSLSYLSSKLKNASGTMYDGKAMLLSGVYNMAAGVDAFATIGWGDYQFNSFSNTQNDGFAVIGGMMLSF